MLGRDHEALPPAGKAHHLMPQRTARLLAGTAVNGGGVDGPRLEQLQTGGIRAGQPRKACRRPVPLQRSGEKRQRRIAPGDRHRRSKGGERLYFNPRAGEHVPAGGCLRESGPEAGREAPVAHEGECHLRTVDFPHEKAGGLQCRRGEACGCHRELGGDAEELLDTRAEGGGERERDL